MGIKGKGRKGRKRIKRKAWEKEGKEKKNVVHEGKRSRRTQ